MIPVIATPILNGTNWLYRLVDSVDYAVDNFVIFNNGNKKIVDELDELSEASHAFIQNIEVCHLPSNIGVSAVWNLVIKSYLTHPYWLIVNHDISFTEGFLKKFHEKAQDPTIGIISASKSSFDCFLLKDWVVQKIGLFDENLSPAYCEDVDYFFRILDYNSKNNNIIKSACIDCPKGNHPYYHGNYLTTHPDCYEKGGSQTKKYDPVTSHRYDRIHQINYDYMNNKWGPNWESFLLKKLGNQYSENNQQALVQNKDLKQYDLDFVRKKYFSS